MWGFGSPSNKFGENVTHTDTNLSAALGVQLREILNVKFEPASVDYDRAFLEANTDGHFTAGKVARSVKGVDVHFEKEITVTAGQQSVQYVASSAANMPISGPLYLRANQKTQVAGITIGVVVVGKDASGSAQTYTDTTFWSSANGVKKQIVGPGTANWSEITSVTINLFTGLGGWATLSANAVFTLSGRAYTGPTSTYSSVKAFFDVLHAKPGYTVAYVDYTAETSHPLTVYGTLLGLEELGFMGNQPITLNSTGTKWNEASAPVPIYGNITPHLDHTTVGTSTTRTAHSWGLGDYTVTGTTPATSAIAAANQDYGFGDPTGVSDRSLVVPDLGTTYVPDLGGTVLKLKGTYPTKGPYTAYLFDASNNKFGPLFSAFPGNANALSTNKPRKVLTLSLPNLPVGSYTLKLYHGTADTEIVATGTIVVVRRHRVHSAYAMRKNFPPDLYKVGVRQIQREELIDGYDESNSVKDVSVS
jgi:hypothetical protein